MADGLDSLLDDTLDEFTAEAAPSPDRGAAASAAGVSYRCPVFSSLSLMLALVVCILASRCYGYIKLQSLASH
jgi:hypothetical protein